MAFEGLSDKLQAAFKKLTGKGKLNEQNIKDAMREVRMALLEADVNYKVVKDFIKKVTERCVGAEVLDSPDAGAAGHQDRQRGADRADGRQQRQADLVLQAADDLHARAACRAPVRPPWRPSWPAASKKQGKKPLLVACDIYRPAAIKQLQVVGEQVGRPGLRDGHGRPGEDRRGGHRARHGTTATTCVILDTAGRLHIDEALMDELTRIKAAVKPQEILLVVDAMTGQDAVNVAKTFNEQLDIDGVILTKLDGDTRGGAALSVRAVTGKPIKFAGIGRKAGRHRALPPRPHGLAASSAWAIC